MVWAILAMLVVILLYDQLLFRPLVAWSAKFRFETTAAATAVDPWVLRLIRRTRWLSIIGHGIGDVATALGGLRLSLPGRRTAAADRQPSRLVDALWLAVLCSGTGLGDVARCRIRVGQALLVRS